MRTYASRMPSQQSQARARGASPAATSARPGNQALQQASRAQARIGRLDDPQEAEADRMAQAMVSGGAGAVGARRPSAAANRLFGARTGRPLDRATRTRFEPSLGDLSSVRVHDDPAARSMAEALHARAYTSGSHIGFAEGEYDPASASGRALIAHELAHVAQGGEVLRRKPKRDEPPVPRPPTSLSLLDPAQACGGQPCFTDEQIYAPLEASRAEDRKREEQVTLRRRLAGMPGFEDLPRDVEIDWQQQGSMLTITQTIVREGLYSRLVTTAEPAPFRIVDQRLYRRDDGRNPDWTDVTSQAARGGKLSVEWNMPDLRTDLEKLQAIEKPGLLYGFLPFHTSLYLRDQTLGIKNPYLRMQGSALQQTLRAVSKVDADLVEYAVTSLAPDLMPGAKLGMQKMISLGFTGVERIGSGLMRTAGAVFGKIAKLAKGQLGGNLQKVLTSLVLATRDVIPYEAGSAARPVAGLVERAAVSTTVSAADEAAAVLPTQAARVAEVSPVAQAAPAVATEAAQVPIAAATAELASSAPASLPALAIQGFEEAFSESAATYDEAAYETSTRLKKGNFGERAAARELAAQGHLILYFKPSILGTNQGGIDIVTMRDGVVYFIDNKAYSTGRDVSSVSALDTNLEQNVEAVRDEFVAYSLDPARPQAERDMFAAAVRAIDAGEYQKAVTTFALASSQGQSKGITPGLRSKGFIFIDLFPFGPP